MGAALAHAVLPDSEAKKVKAGVPFVLVEGMRDVGLFGLETQAHFRQPVLRAGLGFEQHVQVIAENDEIIGIANDHDTMFPSVA